jgi:hypothetical protein
MSQQDKGK